jgi:hypothetical protein
MDARLQAYDLDPANNRIGAEILNEIMAAAEDHRDKVTIILAGYRQDVEQKLYVLCTRLAHEPSANFGALNSSESK